MTKAKLVVRFDLVADSEPNEEALYLLSKLPVASYERVKGQTWKMIDGRESSLPSRNTRYNYEFRFEVFDLNEPNGTIFNIWIGHESVIKGLSESHGFRLKVNYEITISNCEHPGMTFDPKYLYFLSQLSAELSLTFYDA